MMATREIIKPQSQTYALHIPKEYLNKEIEVIILPAFTSSPKDRAPSLGTFDPTLYHGVAAAPKEEIDRFLADIRGEW